MKQVVVTGANGFVGRNLRQHLGERPDISCAGITRATSREEAVRLVRQADVIVHLAGVNRPEDPAEFAEVNAGLTTWLIEALRSAGPGPRPAPLVIHSSSIQASLDHPYGRSKQAAEEALLAADREGLLAARIFRLPNVFGKWSRPNYNSAVATFCHNIARGLPIVMPDPNAALQLVYIDDVVGSFLQIIDGSAPDSIRVKVTPEYSTTVGEVARIIQGFREIRESLFTDRVGTGLVRALYATYVSHLPTSAFAYPVARHADSRGEFVEMLKTPDSGQFSYFTAGPGIIRGGHYHHTKTEKFLVIRGHARFRFRHLQSGEFLELDTMGGDPVIVESVPGWTHDIKNVGQDELIVMLWANEIFDRARPDTVACPL